ncbi:uncharacterized protein ACA1_158780 [Acanthamoeba castellanii str. Neff]|uniref:Fungal lipase-type domain-containing protein n=1 Tax=Acanthamoeba castellanii (strain ATCC 30010 / Neff) TaxID=1257118 RepID=L8HBK1_ACACF|nr:uncharacterized protein ACA1_158780 [Acanthamoeba castellanii str. Neff]ELR22083.1 hypothetical protein ACA1_158780 [Acanthamoeba castellanii str. Neff]
MLRAHSVVRPDLSEEEEDPRLLLNGSLASDGDFSETESYGSPLPQPRTGTHRHRYDDDSGEHGSVFAPAVLPAGHRKSLKSLPKMRRLKESVWDFVSVITYLYCMYVFVVVFVTTISFSINFLSQLIFTCATARNFSSAVYPVVVIALIIFGLYAVTAFPILIHDVFALVADSVPRRAQYRKFADRLLFTTLPQRVLSRWYSPEASLLLPAREVDTRRHAVVRTIIIVPSVIAAIPVAVVAGDVSLFPAWFLCISFLVCLGLAVLFIITGYFKALSEHCEYYRWIRVQWAEAPYKLPGGGSAGESERSGDASWGRALVIRTGLVLAALATPLSFHNAVKGHRMEVAEQEALEEEVAINLGFVPPRKQPGCFRSCFRATKRVLWSSTWLLLPLSVFVIVTMFCLISVRAGVSALLFFLLSFPAVGIAFKHIWKGKASIWPLAVYVVLLGLTLLGFGFLLGSLSTQTQAAHISPDSPALLNLLPPPLPLDSSSATSSSPSSPPHLIFFFFIITFFAIVVYQLCNAQWGDLDIVDFGLLSWLAYFEINSTDYWRYADHWFNGSDWQLRHFQQEPVHFFDFYSPSRNLSVVSVRGTASIVDGLEDLDLWSEALQLELVSMVFPFVFTWPDSSTAVLVQVMSYLERMFVPTDDDFSYFSSVLAYVQLIKSQRKVMMTGHSLGGSVAQVVGAKEGLPAITYNAPGIVYSRRKFGVEFDAIQQWTATIRTTSDLISAIDQPGGTVQDVRCDTEMAFPDCHFLGHLLCPLLRGGCGHHTLDQPSPIVC